MEADSPPSTPPAPVENQAKEAAAHPGVLKKTSWVKIVTNKPSLRKHNFESSASGVVPVPEAVLKDVPLWDDLLVGQFLTTAPHVAKVHVIVNKIWPLGDKTIKIDVFVVNDKMIKFRIKDVATRSRVLRRGMWNIADIPMLVSKWTPIIEEAQPTISTMPLWVTIKHVPHSMFSWDGLGFLASATGEPKRLHPETETCQNFEEAKVFVEVDLSKELPKHFKFQIEAGKDEEVEFVYPWLPPRCSRCGRWGHVEEGCKVIKKITILKRGEPLPVSGSQSMEDNMSQVTDPKTGDVDCVISPPLVAIQTEVVMQPEIQIEAVVGSIIATPMEGHSLTIEPSSVPVERQTMSKSSSGKQSAVEATWTEISPTKAGRLKEHVSSPILTSTPSRFSVLEDKVSMEEGITELDEKVLEEGEFREDVEENDRETEKEEEVENTDGLEEAEDVVSASKEEVVLRAATGHRSSLTRVSKTNHKVLIDKKTQRKPQSKSQLQRTSKKKK